jgi:hypothetical protein
MAYFKLIQFGGIAPQVSPRLLEDTLRLKQRQTLT